MHSANRRISGLAVVLLSILVPVAVAFGQAAHVRWDIVSVVPPNVNTGGIASAMTNDGSQTTLTDARTFVALSDRAGTSNAATYFEGVSATEMKTRCISGDKDVIKCICDGKAGSEEKCKACGGKWTDSYTLICQ